MHKQLFSSVPQSSRSKYFRIFPEKTWWSPFLVNLQRKLTQKVLKDVSLVGLRKFIPLPINSSKSRANVSYSTKGNSITNSSNIFLNPFRTCKSTHLIQFMFSETEREEERGKKRERELTTYAYKECLSLKFWKIYTLPSCPINQPINHHF